MQLETLFKSASSFANQLITIDGYLQASDDDPPDVFLLSSPVDTDKRLLIDHPFEKFLRILLQGYMEEARQQPEAYKISMEGRFIEKNAAGVPVLTDIREINLWVELPHEFKHYLKGGGFRVRIRIRFESERLKKWPHCAEYETTQFFEFSARDRVVARVDVISPMSIDQLLHKVVTVRGLISRTDNFFLSCPYILDNWQEPYRLHIKAPEINTILRGAVPMSYGGWPPYPQDVVITGYLKQDVNILFDLEQSFYEGALSFALQLTDIEKITVTEFDLIDLKR